MSRVRRQCKEFKANFFRTVATDPQTAATMFGSIYRLKEISDPSLTEDETAQLSEALEFVSGRLAPIHIQQMWQASIDKDGFTEDTKASLDCLISHMLMSAEFFNHLSNELLLLNKDQKWYRDIFIALIRNHLLLTGAQDPFAENFSYAFFRIGNALQNSIYVAGFVKQCPSLPLKELTKLATIHPNIAEMLLKDLTGCNVFYEMSSAFVKLHPSIATFVATRWKANLETNPHTQEQKDKIAPLLKRLKKKHAKEFAAVELDGLVDRANPMGGEISVNLPTQQSTYYIVASGLAALTYFGTQIVRNGYFVPIVASCSAGVSAACAATVLGTGASLVAPVLIPVALAAGGFGLAELGREAKRQNGLK
ncbi:MAG: hypothetical protein ACHQJ6_03190 [Candidatus Berkiellales bacterium]